MMRNPALERQIRAARPDQSTWLSANAGSGKTRVLTDRVARLLLGNVDPTRILCLTYTKAAASEMQNRLFHLLGTWAMQPDPVLRASLAELGIDGAIDAETLAKARRLFARAIETPGGLRIQTIHSFCATLLRRFPLEAGVSPQFTELDDRAAALLRQTLVEELADDGAPDAMATIARYYTAGTFDELAGEIADNRAHFEPPLTAQSALALFGLPPDTTESTVLADVFLGGEQEMIAAAQTILADGSSRDQGIARKMAAIDWRSITLQTLVDLELVLMYQESTVDGRSFTAKLDDLATKATKPRLAPVQDRLNALGLRIESARQRRLSLIAAQRTAALHGFAAAFLPLYAARKTARGALDFDDLIQRAKALLTDPRVAQWVLFRLDGGIDHILVDEAQDTSPDQWRVIELLAQEFTAGKGARDTPRTIFVVGDPKQSIYSFQGAEVQAFSAMRDVFKTRLAAVNAPFDALDLEYSFRSSTAILRLVDLVFDERTNADLGGQSKHLAFRDTMPGQIELWPALSKSPEAQDGAWDDPVDLIAQDHHYPRLAAAIAARIRAMLDQGMRIPSKDGPRLAHAGDVLILVRGRSGIFPHIIRACKAANLPIAGADRLKLGGELAVKDMAALLAFLATPEDDLALAAALRSPLLGWTEEQLFTLAHGREGYLWAALRDAADQHPDTTEILRDLRMQADFLRPFDLIERLLSRHHGRARLLARLGPEAEDGINELLSQALAYERNDVPSLTGFLTWLQTDDIEVKRQMDSASPRIRVMTVHGAKGLEAPIVILPETTDPRANDRGTVLPIPGVSAVWRSAQGDSAALVDAAKAERARNAEAESLRLLYVALTRAQSMLIVAAAGETKTPQSWYNLVAAGMQKVGADRAADGSLIYRTGEWPAPIVAAYTSDSAETDPLPAWATQAAAAATRPPKPLSPSNLGGAKVLPGDHESDDDSDAARQRGTALHRLLELLPTYPPAQWPAIAAAVVPDPQTRAALLAESQKVLTNPALAPLFAEPALTEVTLTATLDGQRMIGTIDRLMIGPDSVLAIDYKSNAIVPTTAADIPEGLQRQVRAYAVALRQIYPHHKITTAILWTKTATLMPVDC